ncbi:MAG: hypothetical protein PHY34_01380 [Patescibacteria group bacterium]|nr:hypothetical protein [Patescibacteria group bacterium]MDD5715128.1 hypothetical protein [Patescibacteria group bacterium]
MKNNTASIQARKRLLFIIHEIVIEIFKASFISYLLFYLVENFKVGLISNIFNLNILLIITCVSGLLTIIFRDETVAYKKINISLGSYIIFFLIAIAVALIIYNKIKMIGPMSYFISIIIGIILILFPITLSNDQSN